MEEKKSNYILAYTLANRFEADIIADALEQENIPFWIKSFEDTAYDGLFVFQKGWGHLMVPSEYYHKTLQIVYSLLKDSPKKGSYEDPEEIDPLLWKQLSDLNPEQVCSNCGVSFDAVNGAYIVPFLSGYIKVKPDANLITFLDTLPYNKMDFETALITLNYLINGQAVDISGRWVGEKDLPGGFVFFQGPHQLPTRPLAEMFQMDPNYFMKAAKELNATKASEGDFSYVFNVFPKVPVMLVFWQGSDEFEPQVVFRFDETVTLHLPVLDQIFALTYVLYRQIEYAAKKSYSNS